MFRANRVYMHKNAMDVALFVEKVHDTSVEGHWVNLGYTGNPWSLTGFSSEKLQFTDWHDVTLFFKHKRTRPGLPC